MSKIAVVYNGNDEIERYIFHCPACECYHWFKTDGVEPVWSWNGDFVRPTISPSILVRSGDEKGDTVCHFFVRDGKIEYLNDCTHRLAGKTVDMVAE